MISNIKYISVISFVVWLLMILLIDFDKFGLYYIEYSIAVPILGLGFFAYKSFYVRKNRNKNKNKRPTLIDRDEYINNKNVIIPKEVYLKQ